MIEKDTKPPKAVIADHTHTAVKAALSMIPLAGGPASELFNSIVTPPISKRRDDWVTSIAQGLVELQEKVEGVSIESLSNSEQFITTVMHATQAAIRNHSEEKLFALRNAVLNTATNNSPDDDLQLIFLNFIDICTPWHLRILKFLQDPKGFGASKNIVHPNYYMGGVSTVLQRTFPEIADKRSFYDKIVDDLSSQGLITGDSSMLHSTMSADGMFLKRTSEMGDKFLDFIEYPQYV